MSVHGRTLLALAILALSVFGAAPADAVIRYRGLPPFGPIAEPNGLAVNQSSGNVLVTSVGENAVEQFRRKGVNEYEALGALTGGETPQGAFVFHHNEPAPVALDSASEVVYVVDPGHFVVDEFNAEGKYVCQLSGVGRGCRPNPASELGSPPTFEELTGVTVDSLGNVYVSDYTHEVVDEFTAAGADVGQIRGGGITNPSGVAVDSSGVVYVQNYFGSVGDVVRLVLNAGDEVINSSVLDPAKSFAVALDPSTNDVYVDHGSSIAVYGPAQEALGSFSVGHAESEGVAVNGAQHDIYVTDKVANDVQVFEAVTVPDVTGCEAPTEVGPTSATLHGGVDPLGSEGASWHFQYGTTAAYGLETPATPIAGNATQPVEASVTGLTPGTTYHYRLDATNNTGVIDEGEDCTFTTSLALPVLSEISVSRTSGGGALFAGTINPGNSETTYRFAYGLRAGSYETALPSFVIAAGLENVAVAQLSEATLVPGTTYHFTLIAVNASGESKSPDQAFTTADEGLLRTVAPVVSTGVASAIGTSAATLSGTVASQGLPTTYAIEIGPTTGYGTSIFGSLTRATSAIPVSASIGGLQPGTIYHYRVTAWNAAGRTHGADETFATPSLPLAIVQPLAPLLIPVPANATVPLQKSRKPSRKARRPRRSHRKTKGHGKRPRR